MKISFTKSPLRLLLGGILTVLGILALIGLNFPALSIIFTVVGLITGVLLLFKTRFL
jgi:hypothetical protein